MSSSNDFSHPTLTNGFPTEGMLQEYFIGMTECFSDEITQRCARLDRRADGVKHGILQSMATSRAGQLLPCFQSICLTRARQIQHQRSQLVQTLQHYAQQLLSSRSLTSPSGVQEGGGRGPPQDGARSGRCSNLEVVWGAVEAAMGREPAYYQVPLRPPVAALEAFAAEAVLKRRIHEELASALGDHQGGGASLPAREERDRNGGSTSNTTVVQEALRLLLQCMRHTPVPTPRGETSGVANSQTEDLLATHCLDEEGGGSGVAKGAVDPADSSGSTLKVDGMRAADPASSDGLFCTLSLPLFVSLKQYCSDGSWVSPGTPLADLKEKKKPRGYEAAGEEPTLGFLFTPPTRMAESDPSGLRLQDQSCMETTSDGDNDAEERPHVGSSQQQRLTFDLVRVLTCAVDAAWAGVPSTVTDYLSEKGLPKLPAGTASDNADRDDNDWIWSVEQLMDVLRIAYKVELVARVLALRTSMQVLVESDTAALFDSVRASSFILAAPCGTTIWRDTPGSGTPPLGCTQFSTPNEVCLSTLEEYLEGIKKKAIGATFVPMTVLNLPGIESVFYCIAYTTGAALLRDAMIAIQHAAQGLHAAAPIDVDSLAEHCGPYKDDGLNEEREDTTAMEQSPHDGGGTTDANRIALGRFVGVLDQAMMGTLPAFPSFAQAQRIWTYLWENVFLVEDSYSTGSSSLPCAIPAQRGEKDGPMECVRLTMRLARRWMSAQATAAVDYALKHTFLICSLPLRRRLADNRAIANENNTTSELVETTARRMQQAMMRVLESKEK